MDFRLRGNDEISRASPDVSGWCNSGAEGGWGWVSGYQRNRRQDIRRIGYQVNPRDKLRG